MKSGLALTALLLLGCGPADLDLLASVQQRDPCLGFTSERDCDANLALGCWYQPNEVGCRSTDASCQPGACRSGDPFVRRVERSFFLNGVPFRFAGVSSWALLPATSCSGVKVDERQAWLERAYDELVPGRTKVARFFAFQSAAGPSGKDFSLLDAAVRAARRAGVRLQLILEHASGGCSQGAERNDAWYTAGFRSPDGDYALSYQDYALAVAQHFRDEPTVLGYTLLQSLGVGSATPQSLQGFVSDMGERLHEVAPYQLVSLDLVWGRLSPEEYAGLQGLGVVDFVDIDDYDFADPSEPVSPELLAAIAPLPKPAVIAEGAFELEGDDRASLERRAARASGRMAEWKSAGLSGALFWAYQPGWTAVSEEFDARADDPMLQPGGVLDRAPW
jgi:mannan endo-1,4-beta-mannosidase